MSPTERGLKCKHCGIEIAPHANGQAWFHPGNFRGKNTCEIEPYGYNAEPHGQPCSVFCAGHTPGLSVVES
ncbi:hypothetical protein CH274_13330 [Rhodococcus sp. 06-418-5]|nr:hypothetical protein CH274_13330 [Rhodococcus sp. 06-418-5]